MAESNAQEPINGFDRLQIEKMINHQITRFADYARMQSFWRRLLAGDNDPEEIVQGLCMALSTGRYIVNPGAGVVHNITFNIAGDADPVAMASALKAAFDGAARTHR